MSNTTPRGLELFVCIIVFTAICSIFLSLRVWAARIVQRPLYIDDGLVSFAFACALTLSGALFWLIFNGMGKHITEVTPEELGITFQAVTIAYVCWTLGTGAVKLSVLVMYMRIFRTQNFRRCACVLMGVIATFTVSFFVVFLTNCTPISQMWDPVPWGHCREQSPSEFASLSCNLAIDLAIIILPFPWLWKLQMPTRNKITVSVTLSIGFTTIGIMIWRYPVTVQSSKDGDFTYHIVTVALITMLELWLGVIVACIPTLAPLVNRHIKPALVEVVKSIRHRTTRRTSSGVDSKEVGSGAHRLTTIGGSSGRAERFKTGRYYSELPDDSSHEIISDPKGHLVHQGDSPSLVPTDLEAGRTGPYMSSNMSPHYGQSRALTTTCIVSEPRTALKTRNNQVPQGRIHVERIISASQES